MFKSVSQNSQGQCFCLCNSFVPAIPVHHDSRKLWDFSNPAAILFSLDFDLHTVTYKIGYLT